MSEMYLYSSLIRLNPWAVSSCQRISDLIVTTALSLKFPLRGSWTSGKYISWDKPITNRVGDIFVAWESSNKGEESEEIRSVRMPDLIQAIKISCFVLLIILSINNFCLILHSSFGPLGILLYVKMQNIFMI